jgi:hypothetical protein
MGWRLGNLFAPRSSSAARDSRRAVVEQIEPRVLMTTVHLSTHFADGNFLPGNWSITMSNVGGGGTQSAARVTKGGHPGAYRIIYNTVFASGTGSVDYGFNAYRLGNYNPAVKGAINSIAYSEDSKLIQGGGQGQGTGPALIQNGVVYFAPGLITPKTTWTHQVRAKLTAANFVAADLKSHPDFSQSGAPMQFGFYRANSAGIPGYSITAAIDNFSLTIKSAKTTVKK